MWKSVLVLVGLVLGACAQVPYDKDGRIIVPATANFASPAREGAIDSALDELIVKINPGAEEVRSIALFTMAALVACELKDCRRNRGGTSRRNRNIAIGVDATIGANLSASRIENFERTDLQIQELTDLAQAIATIAERDSGALATADTLDGAESWVALYQNRQQKLAAAQEAVMNNSRQMTALSRTLPKTSVSRDLARRLADLQESSAENLMIVSQSTVRLDRAIADMRRGAGFSQ